MARVGAFGLLLWFVIGLSKGWWLTSQHHAEVASEKERRLAENRELFKRQEEDADALLAVVQEMQETQTRFLDLLRQRPCLLDAPPPRRTPR